MHISKIRIQNYRCFSDITLLFQAGLNVVLGENNAGKSALFNAMRLVFERGSQQLTVYDFHHASLSGDKPPRIVVTATIEVKESDSAEDKAAVATWLTQLNFPWEAELSFVYELPEKYHETFKNLREAFGDGTDTEKSAYAIEMLQDRGRFVSKHFGGALENGFTAEPELRAHFQCRFLDALRDAEKHLESGSSALLRRMLRQMLDRESDEDERSEKERKFRTEGGKLVDGLSGRISTEPLFKTAREIWGAGQKAGPTLFGRLTELEVLKSIWLYLKHESHQHPVSHNGLGFNNLLYVGLVLAGMASSVEPDEPPEFPILLLEEPEAHLHPALQYRFLVFLRDQLRSASGGPPKSRQVFLTTHSTQVTSAAGLDPLVCLYLDVTGTPNVAYPGRAFPNSKAGQASKAYVERFLDATKSSMLFAKGVLLVEGIAEQVLIPGLVDLSWGGQGAWLERNFVSLVRVDGVTFKHFLPLFGVVDDPELAKKGLQSRPLSLVTDGDPVIACEENGKKKARRCWPYELEAQLSATAQSLAALGDKHAPILHVGLADKTFEYDLAAVNPEAKFLLTDATTYAAKKRAKFEKHMDGGDPLDKAWKEWWPDDLGALEVYAQTCDEDEKLRATALATYYLLAYEDSKGEHASQIAAGIASELAKKPEKRQPVCLPTYLEHALRHVCVLEPPKPAEHDA